MKILYIASNPEDAAPLQVEKELNLLREKIDQIQTSEQIDLRTYSNVKVDDLPFLVSHLRPDILHFSAHGLDDGIVLAHEERGHVHLTGGSLASLLAAISVRPRLIVINACSSTAMASKLTGVADYVLGTDAPISNVGARSMAAILYQQLADGSSIGDAFATARSILDTVDGGEVSSQLFPSEHEEQARKTFVANPFRIVACFPKVDQWLEQRQTEPQKGFNREIPFVRFGVDGAPPTSRQLLIFTDDETIVPEDDESLADARAWFEECQVVHGEIWIDEEASYFGDLQWYAAVTTGDRKIHSCTSGMVEALKRYYFLEQWRGELPPRIEELVEETLSNLTFNDGSRRRQSVPRRASFTK